ncbi:MAG: hypothetical protein OHK0023_06560 [Anaerolineae bacterium]
MFRIEFWLFLSLSMGALLLLVQRTERGRRGLVLIFALFGCYLLAAFGLYRMIQTCEWFPRLVCSLWQRWDNRIVGAYATLNWSIVTALLLNALFWLFIGRYNPPASSDEIKVLGLND